MLWRWSAFLPVCLLAVGGGLSAPRHRRQEGGVKCGLQGCPTSAPGYLNVHIVCHSHNDAGWIEPVDTMYNTAVQHIYSSVVDSLSRYPERRYVSAENVFFSRWLVENQNVGNLTTVQRLVDSGQLQFVGGGWTQNDEATTHYTAIIDQMTMGLRFLNNTFGQCGKVTVGWQLDPFGHSQAFASLLAQMGFDGLFLGRAHYALFQQKSETKRLEFIWKASPLLGKVSDLLTIILFNRYEPPPSLCINDVYCSSYDTLVTRPSAELTQVADFILDDIAIQAKAYATKNIMLTIGGDLSFQNAQNWFNQVDSAIRMVNNVSRKKGRRVRLFYSTPLCYLASLHAANQSWPVFRGDLFPYADNPTRAWTGFYTSRPNLKGFARYANGFLQACKQLAVIGGKRDTRTKRLKEAVAILQHHDAITGTSKRTVAEDYSLLLWKGIVDCEAVIGSAVTKLTGQSEANLQWGFCHALNISQCAITESWGALGPNEQRSGPTELTVLVYNPMSQALSTYVRLPVNDGHSFEVRDYQGRDAESQVMPLIMTIPNIPDRRSFARSELVIPVELPPLGYTMFYATKRAKPGAQIMERNINFLQLEPEYRFIENDRYRLEVDTTTGLLLHVTFLGLELAMSLKQSFYVYKMAVPRLQFTVPAGGAYTFLPDRDEPFDLGSHVTYRIVKGNHVQEIHQIFNHWVSQVIRLYRKSEFIEFEWIIGPIPDKYETRLDNGDVFFTDSNGLETIQRRWVKLNESVYPQSVASNYYPVVSWIYLKGRTRNLQMTVVTDRAQGGTSPQQGCLELMLHRRYFVDDNLGVEEALDDRGAGGEGVVVKGKHFVHLGTPREALLIMRRAALQQVYQPVVLFAHTPFAPIPKKRHSELRARLPEGLHLMSLENVAGDQALLRLEHTLFEGMLNTSITHLLSSFLVVDIKETVLSGHLYLTELSKTEHEQTRATNVMPDGWPKATRSVAAVPAKASFQELNNVLVTLRPGQIRTFLAKLQPFTGPSRAAAK